VHYELSPEARQLMDEIVAELGQGSVAEASTANTNGNGGAANARRSAEKGEAMTCLQVGPRAPCVPRVSCALLPSGSAPLDCGSTRSMLRNDRSAAQVGVPLAAISAAANVQRLQLANPTHPPRHRS
jgi:hypothetical protein